MNTLNIWLILSVSSLLVCQLCIMIIVMRLNGRVEELENFLDALIEWEEEEADHGEEE